MKVRKAHMREKLRKLRGILVDSKRSKSFIFICFNIIMGSVSAVMTAVNIVTAKWLLMGSTLLFAIACAGNVCLYMRYRKRKLAVYLFLAEGISICCFFCISGTPEGFSALWTCFIPSFTLTLLGNKSGSIYSGLTFVMVAFLFWTPPGQSLLQYEYTDSFMLRFPMIYLAFFAMALFLETARTETQRHLLEAERRYQHLYKHDALTGIYNRYGFNERVDEVFADPKVEEITLMIVDLDFFKRVNDTYGHDMGDVVLCFAADLICQSAGKGAVVCRWGGEEFTVLLCDGRNPVEQAERIRQTVEANSVREGDTDINITVSIGVCTITEREEVTIAQLVKRADECLYEAKKGGRNRVVAVRI